MAKPREARQKDLLRPALEDIIDLGHPLVRLARAIDWQFLDSQVLANRHYRRDWWRGCSS
jgi:transposase, IS5 family